MVSLLIHGLLLVVIVLASPTVFAASKFAEVCPDFPNTREPEMQIQPDEFSETVVRDILRRLETDPAKGLETGELGRPIDSWTIFLKGYLLRSEWLLAKAAKKSESEIELRRKEFCEFLVKDGYYVD